VTAALRVQRVNSNIGTRDIAVKISQTEKSVRSSSNEAQRVKSRALFTPPRLG